jgi:hypothetical protein
LSPDDNRPPLPYDFLPPAPSLTVGSDDISHGERLPSAQVYNGLGHDGDNQSPHLMWSDFPAETKSFAITCYDPDAPTGSGFWHWVLFDIPGDVTELAAGAGSGDRDLLPPGATQARNDYGTQEFGGAAPPEGHGEHRYVFAVHALDVEKLGIDENASPAFVGFNITAHTLARGLLIPVYSA